jgi:hypothetical protein
MPVTIWAMCPRMMLQLGECFEISVQQDAEAGTFGQGRELSISFDDGHLSGWQAADAEGVRFRCHPPHYYITGLSLEIADC